MPKGKKVTDNQKLEVIEMHLALGFSIDKIMGMSGLSQWSITKILKAYVGNNIKNECMRECCRKNKRELERVKKVNHVQKAKLDKIEGIFAY